MNENILDQKFLPVQLVCEYSQNPKFETPNCRKINVGGGQVNFIDELLTEAEQLVFSPLLPPSICCSYGVHWNLQSPRVSPWQADLSS